MEKNIKYEVLDSGYVELIDVMGSDESIAKIAGISYGEETLDESKMENRIRFMMSHGHTSPFEFAEMVFKIKCPIYVARQWMRHRTASILERSQRYSDALEVQDVKEWEIRGDGIDDKFMEKSSSEMLDSTNASRKDYAGLVESGVKKEQARVVLPLATYTEFYWKMDLHNLFHFLKLRLNPSAQEEIRAYAKAIFEIVSHVFPISAKHFDNSVLKSMTLCGHEVDALKTVLKTCTENSFLELPFVNWGEKELSELTEKLDTLGLHFEDCK